MELFFVTSFKNSYKDIKRFESCSIELPKVKECDAREAK
jgi:hypothetical protein